MTMGFVTIGSESTTSLIGHITLQMIVNRVSVVREICMLRLTRRGLETGFEYRASPRPYWREGRRKRKSSLPLSIQQ